MSKLLDILNDRFIGKTCVIRSDRAGVFAAKLEAREGTTVYITEARRLWYWDGAASLSELSQKGVAAPGTCKFPTKMKELIVEGVLEIIPMTEQAIKAVDEVPVWGRFKA